MAKHLSWLNPDTCGCQVVSWFDDELPADQQVHLAERMGEIDSGVRLGAELASGATRVVLDLAPDRPILVGHVIMVPREMMLVTAVESPTELTVVRGHESTEQGKRASHPAFYPPIDQADFGRQQLSSDPFFYIPHPAASKVFVRRPCVEHDAFTDGKALRDAVFEENNRKNVALGLIGTLATVDRDDVWAVIAKQDKGDGKGGWRFDASSPRVVTFNFAGLLQQIELTAMDDAASLQFGPGLVTLERA